MAVSRTTVACAFAFLAAFAGSLADDDVSTFEGYIKLYARIYYGDPFLTVNFNYPNRCYNLDCDTLNNKIASAKWKNLPTIGFDGRAYIAFYSDKDCTGYKSTYELPHFGGIRDFDVQKVKGNITCFMVLSESKVVENGISDVCDWSSVGAEGDVVEEDPTLSLSV
ncbi:hypothetical protein BBJ28_00003466 [Nothophytophthora sp. Chile5]|nr:hypothetical protein BBJ28_00003466 [Nothophytophthora sp. Chile5]